MRSMRSELEPQGYVGGRNCSRKYEQERTSNSEVVNLIAQRKTVAVWGGGGEKRLLINTSSRLNFIGFCSPSRHHQRRLGPPVYGSPTENKAKQNQTKQEKYTPHTQPRFRRRTSPRPLPSPDRSYSNSPNRHSSSSSSSSSTLSSSPPTSLSLSIATPFCLLPLPSLLSSSLSLLMLSSARRSDL
jgi:hypothetical protein